MAERLKRRWTRWMKSGRRAFILNLQAWKNMVLYCSLEKRRSFPAVFSIHMKDSMEWVGSGIAEMADITLGNSRMKISLVYGPCAGTRFQRRTNEVYLQLQWAHEDAFSMHWHGMLSGLGTNTKHLKVSSAHLTQKCGSQCSGAPNMKWISTYTCSHLLCDSKGWKGFIWTIKSGRTRCSKDDISKRWPLYESRLIFSNNLLSVKEHETNSYFIKSKPFLPTTGYCWVCSTCVTSGGPCAFYGCWCVDLIFLAQQFR